MLSLFFSKPLLYITITDKQSYLYQPSVAYFAHEFLRMFAPNGPGWWPVSYLAWPLFLSIELFNFLGYCLLHIHSYIAILHSSKKKKIEKKKKLSQLTSNWKLMSKVFFLVTLNLPQPFRNQKFASLLETAWLHPPIAPHNALPQPPVELHPLNILL